MNRAIGAVLGIVIAVPAAGAQGPDSLLKTGARVRVSQSASHWIKKEGFVLARRGDSIDVRVALRHESSSEQQLTVVNLTLQELDSLSVAVPLKRRNHATAAMVVGAAAGYLAALNCSDTHFNTGPSCKKAAPITGALAGLLLEGTLRRLPKSRWVPVDLK